MDYRQLGNSGLKVSVLTMGTMTFEGKGVFARVGDVSLEDVRRLIDICADAGVNLIDTADIYSAGRRAVAAALGSSAATRSTTESAKQDPPYRLDWMWLRSTG
jgi:aryl-alcohol dehydrogenase-like predicted oxidoreductase